uniref:Uncharacterized protein n=1 Tax=Anguilla anguilla TaxID=7936 RepID=A0A0E9TBW3_ANGAN
MYTEATSILTMKTLNLTRT